jgi:hypothetical protein
MYQPKAWSSLASRLKVLETRLHSGVAGSLSSTRPAQGFSYAIQAVTCADAIDAGDVTTKTVFNEMIGSSWVIDQICKRLRYSLRCIIY